MLSLCSLFPSPPPHCSLPFPNTHACMQTQVCVQQTALDLLEKGYDVHVVADAVSSRSQVDRLFAIEVHARVCEDVIGRGL